MNMNMNLKQRGPLAERYPHREFDKEGIDGLAFCRQCHAVHQNKRWSYDETLYKRMQGDPMAVSTICTGCENVQERRVDGILRLKSPLVREKHEQFLNLIHHEADREREKNPLSRIVQIEERSDEMEIQTTTQFLATRLGHAVERAFQGNLAIDKLSREAFVRVSWQREET